MNDVGFNRTVGIVDLEENVLQCFEDIPNQVRAVFLVRWAQVISLFGVFYMKKSYLHPYHLQKVQALLPDTIMQGLSFRDGF